MINSIGGYLSKGDKKGLDNYLVGLSHISNVHRNQLVNISFIIGFIDGLEEMEKRDLAKEVELPIINTIDDIIKNKDQIIKYVESGPFSADAEKGQENKDIDHVYHIKSRGRFEPGTYSRGQFTVKSDFYIAGSCALNKFIERGIGIPRKVGTFVPGDTDIFILNSDRKFRSNMGQSDFVYVKDKTIEELLLNFDLPCCRVATNPNGDYWISIQCIYSILTGKYFLPTYLATLNTFHQMIQKYPGEELRGVNSGNLIKYSTFLHERLLSRIKKYETRRFTCVNYDTETVLPWIIHRLHYSQPTHLLDDIFQRDVARFGYKNNQ